MSIGVRVAHHGDAAAVQHITDAAFAPLREIYRPSASQRDHVATLALERLVAFVGAEIVGTVRWHVDGDRLRMIGLAVDPAHQRRGIARALVTMLATLARSRRCQALALYTIEQTGNAAVFARLGFTVLSKQRDTSSLSVTGEDLVEVYMERRLAADET